MLRARLRIAAAKARAFFNRTALRSGIKRARGAAYAAAQASRNLADWVFNPITSADRELKSDLTKLRANARDLIRNNPLAARYLDLFVENVLGETGIPLQARVTTGGTATQAGKPDLKQNRLIETAWREWGAPETCTIDGRLSWYDLECLALRSWRGEGEAFVRMLPGAANRFGFALQVIDPDQLDETRDQPPGRGKNEIRMGIEIDRYGRPLAYHVYDRHPHGIHPDHRNTIRIAASEMIHLYTMDRPGQGRGVPDFTPVARRIKMLDGYYEAEVVAARIAASQMGFYRLTDAIPDPNSEDEGYSVDTLTMEAEPGKFGLLLPGMEFESWTPEHPSGAFGPFTKSVLQEIAAGLGVSYAALTGDLERTTYSSARIGQLQDREVWKRARSTMIQHLHERVYREWLKWALTMGALTLPMRNMDRWGAHEWMPRGWQWTDPLKEVQAVAAELSLGLTTRTREAAARGRDFEDLLRERQREDALAEEMGVQLGTDVAVAPASNDMDEDEVAAAPHQNLVIPLSGV